jgi:hypothetical protein
MDTSEITDEKCPSILEVLGFLKFPNITIDNLTENELVTLEFEKPQSIGSDMTPASSVSTLVESPNTLDSEESEQSELSSLSDVETLLSEDSKSKDTNM